MYNLIHPFTAGLIATNAREAEVLHRLQPQRTHAAGHTDCDSQRDDAVHLAPRQPAVQ